MQNIHPDQSKTSLVAEFEGPTTKRTLRVYLMLDCSGSMAGTKIEQLNHAIRDTINEMPSVELEIHARIVIAVIRFSESASWHIGPDPLPVAEVQSRWQDLDAEGGTSFAAALGLIIPELTKEKLGKRNLPPLVLLVSDGYSGDQGDDYEKAVETLNRSSWGQKAVRLSIGIGMTEEEYDKPKLDAFISPYLLKQNVETFPVRNIAEIKNLIEKFTKTAGDSKSRPPEGGGPPTSPVTPPSPPPTEDGGEIASWSVFE